MSVYIQTHRSGDHPAGQPDTQTVERSGRLMKSIGTEIPSPKANPMLFYKRTRLSTYTIRLFWGTALHHRGVLLLEAQSHPLRALHLLVDAAHNAPFLARAQGFGGKVGDAVFEATLDKVLVGAHELLHLFPFHSVLQLVLFGLR